MKKWSHIFKIRPAKLIVVIGFCYFADLNEKWSVWKVGYCLGTWFGLVLNFVRKKSNIMYEREKNSSVRPKKFPQLTVPLFKFNVPRCGVLFWNLFNDDKKHPGEIYFFLPREKVSSTKLSHNFEQNNSIFTVPKFTETFTVYSLRYPLVMSK